ncbi:PTS mannose/fructose/sorbose transporter subunit IIB [Brevibacillus fluminis]|uniref:PTS mannose/fructose/sorbose transporter subunit IIB n=1 Tax=Brevibacillus fluminis TaxID=511487 RepID=A0A3M8DQI3_9BACL|nr:PTS sugar transporter subunit IIB [Brevibacillus fluminis]RNB90388.1 PTS mannose/fructose/sorbose transporter subunit IIB [Brevibacillus fluminis]
MIKLVRIDDRLIHGQVAFAWSKQLDVNCILVANNAVIQDELKKMTLNLAKPPGVKLILLSVNDAIAFLSSEESAKYSILVLVDNAADSLQLAEGVEEIKSINVGGMRMAKGKRMISSAVAVDEADINVFQSLLQIGVEVEVRQVPTEKKKPISELLA